MVKRLQTWFTESVEWRLRRWQSWYREGVVGPASRRHELLGRWMQFPIPTLAPWKRRAIVVQRTGALGDVLMCTPALRRLKRLNPACHVHVITSYPDLLKGLPFIDEVSTEYARPIEAISLGYEHALPTKRHLARIIGDGLGLRTPNVCPSCFVQPELEDHFKKEWLLLPRPRLVINRHAGPWTPNKDWPASHWNELIERLGRRWTIIEIGAPSENDNSSGVAVDLRGRTTRAELVAIMAAADLHAGPISGPVHIAAAMGTPGVVIYGGYEHPSCSGYRTNINLYSPVPCAPCWLRTPCPIGLECLSMITPQMVEMALKRLWAAQLGNNGSRKCTPQLLDHY